ncbi:MAG: hypothetical protein H6673_07125 [Anaerolineales bacterium]|nr:hypothetical protein [Anaerolineales bacterium]
MDKIRKYQIEIKYLVITAILLAGLVWVAQSDTLKNVEEVFEHITVWGTRDEGLVTGALALLILSWMSNATLVIQIPYTLTLMSMVMVTPDFGSVLILTTVSGFGAAMGEITSYVIASNIAAQFESISESGLIRWIQGMIEKYPKSIPAFVFIGSATVLPDDVVIMPLALINYPVKKIMTPMFIGKCIHQFTFAMIAYYGLDIVGDNSRGTQFDVVLVILLVFVMFVAYQIEKTAQNKAKEASQHEEFNPATAQQ